ncbi:hypothetical protein Csp1_20490 [Corynebacterium provencense]|uniref:Uncharacterized protein n=1 Tax=Corynebacterium provencense TaxID=1737425 RepID=A0A2Z3YZR1_9CORY|nr:hypothetical protein [Corynebacterium provencense]AWT26813.1 hypothetical protein Csp1_20490 [Corynebacterium provencense]
MITDTDARRLAAGTHPDPFAALGPTSDGRGIVVHVPGALAVSVVNDTDEAALTPPPRRPGRVHRPSPALLPVARHPARPAQCPGPLRLR